MYDLIRLAATVLTNIFVLSKTLDVALVIEITEDNKVIFGVQVTMQLPPEDELTQAIDERTLPDAGQERTN